MTKITFNKLSPKLCSSKLLIIWRINKQRADDRGLFPETNKNKWKFKGRNIKTIRGLGGTGMTLEIKAVFFCNFPPSHPRAALKMYVSCPRSMGRLRTDNFSACLRLHTLYDRFLFSLLILHPFDICLQTNLKETPDSIFILILLAMYGWYLSQKFFLS